MKKIIANIIYWTFISVIGMVLLAMILFSLSLLWFAPYVGKVIIYLGGMVLGASLLVKVMDWAEENK